jgi:F-type H+-transporting ATPase subunit delta
MSSLTTVARPYAKAAFDYGLQNQNISHWQEMLVFAAEVAGNQQMKDVLKGSLASTVAAELFISVCAEQLDNHGQNFIKVLAENNRLLALPQILDLFNSLKAEYEKEIDVDVTSASELSEQQQSAMSEALEKRLARKVKLICSVDPELVAGVVIKAGDMVIDGTVNSQLNRLSDALQA